MSVSHLFPLIQSLLGPFQPGVRATKDDVIDFYGDIIDPCLTSQCSLLGFDGDKLLAIMLNKIEFSSKDLPQLTVEELNKEYPLKPNYAKGRHCTGPMHWWIYDHSGLLQISPTDPTRARRPTRCTCSSRR